MFYDGEKKEGKDIIISLVGMEARIVLWDKPVLGEGSELPGLGFETMA